MSARGTLAAGLVTVAAVVAPVVASGACAPASSVEAGGGSVAVVSHDDEAPPAAASVPIDEPAAADEPAPADDPAAEVRPLPGQDPAGAGVVGRDVTALLPTRWVGEPVRPADHAATLIRFWTDTCPFCEASLPAVEALRVDLGPGGLQTVGVYHPKPPRAVEDARVVEAAADRGYHGPLAVDADWAKLRALWLDGGGRRATSVSFLLDRRGVVRFVHPGPEFHASDDPAHAACARDEAALRAAVEHVLAEDRAARGREPRAEVDAETDIDTESDVEPASADR